MGTSSSMVGALLLVLCASACAGAPVAVAHPSENASDPSLDAATRLLRRRRLAELVSMPAEARAEAIFGALYNELDRTKPCAITQDEYAARLHARAERSRDSDPWHVRWGVEGTADLNADAVRFYLDVVPEHAATLADELSGDLDRRGLRRYSFKVLRALELFDIPVAAVLYVEGADVEEGRVAALAFARAHPEALWPEEAPFTRRLARGVSMADEIGDRGPPGVSGNSFGGAMAHLVSRAVEGAPEGLDASGLAARIRAELESAGFDPSAPWLRPPAPRSERATSAP